VQSAKPKVSPRLSRRTLARGAAAVLGVLSAACTPGGRATDATPGEGLQARPTALRAGAKVVLLNDANAAGAELVEQVLARWRQSQPEVAVEWIRPQGTVSLTSMVAAGTPPDVWSSETNQFTVFGASGETLALDPYVRRDRLDLGDFYPGSLDLGKLQGRQHGLPRAFNAGVLYTNLNAFDRAGVARPPEKWGGAPWGWDEFLDAARRLSVPSDDPQSMRFGADLLGGNGFFWSFVYANGGALFNADMTAVRLHEPPAVAALQWLADLIHRHRVNPTPEIKTNLGERSIFNNGQTAMQLIGASNVNLYLPITQFAWDWRPVPAGRAGAKTWAVGQVWAISGKTQAREEAWALLQHLTSADSQTTLAGNYFPSGRAAAQRFLATEAAAGRPPANRQLVLEAMQNAVVRPNHPRFADVQKVLDEELAALWKQGGAAQSMADAIKRRADPLLAARG